MSWQTTTYCLKHGALEAVLDEDVLSVGTFMVTEANLPGMPIPNGRSACEVRAITDAGCKVRFIGGAKWLTGIHAARGGISVPTGGAWWNR